jgi:hypothetical protein
MTKMIMTTTAGDRGVKPVAWMGGRCRQREIWNAITATPAAASAELRVPRAFDGRLAAPMGTDRSANDVSWLAAPIVPPVTRPALHGRITRCQLDLNGVVQFENDPAGDHVLNVERVRRVHSWIVGLHGAKQSRELCLHLAHCRFFILYLGWLVCVRWYDEAEESEAANWRKPGGTVQRRAVIRIRRRGIASPQLVKLKAGEKFHSDTFDLRVTGNDGLAVCRMSCYYAANLQNSISSPPTTRVSSGSVQRLDDQPQAAQPEPSITRRPTGAA